MTHDPDSRFQPRAPRFEVADPCETVVTITRTGGDADEPFPSKLVDVSQHGAKLCVPVNLRFEEDLQLRIEVLGTELEYQGVASVRHIRSVGDENWVVGCAIDPPLSDETFSYLATTAGKERRRFRRQPIAAKATVRRQAQADGWTATLHNLSSGGFCCSSAMHYEVGESIQLTIDDVDGRPRMIEARVCWQIDGPEVSIVGCQFSSRNSYAELCACLAEQPVPESRPPREGDPTSKLVLTAAVLAMFVPPMMTLLLQAKKVSAEGSQGPLFAETSEMSTEEVALPAAALTEQVPDEFTRSTQPPAKSPPSVAVVDDDISNDKPPWTPAAEQPEFREWVDNTGKHRSEAKLIDFTLEYVVLKKPNGRDSKVPWHRLSEVDREYVKGWQSRQWSRTGSE